ncbi:MMPL family transporter [Prauserella alba]|uniref:MMPL family transporter n=1 Tax=Prauserella alba TaxID=176898 RepID=A0ABP4FQK1_9PSEU|nr:MMPL family transporter [Prauserella alba]MCP2180344.1 putative drug exporter of the RND superfamily [Prauserella alba]
MAKLLFRLGRTAYRRWPFFLIAWLVVLAGVGTFSVTQSQPMSDQFTIPGIESVEAAEKLPEIMDGQSSPMDEANVQVVVQAPEGEQLAAPRHMRAIDELITDLRGIDTVPQGEQAVVGPVQADAGLQEQALQQARQQAQANGQPFDREAALEQVEPQLAASSPLSEDGRTGLVDFALDVEKVTDVEPETQQEILDVVEQHADSSDLAMEVRGSGMQVMEIGGATAELIGIVMALIILALTFGSLVSAGMPVVTAGIGVAMGSMGITAMTVFTDISSTTPILATMIGLAVGIDYALFILARYRSELEHTDDRPTALGIAVGTAGSAVVFAGLTVIIALAALSVVGIPFLTTMGLAAAATVAIAVLVALTLLPAVVGMLKGKTFGLKFRKYSPKREDSGLVLNNGVRWSRFIGKKPLTWTLLVVVALGALAIPFKDLRLGMPSDSTAPADSSRRQAAEMIGDAFGPGKLDPLMLVVDARGISDDPQAQQAAYQEAQQWAAEQDGVRHIVPAPGNDKGTMVLLQPEFGPDDPRTAQLLDSLRAGEAGFEDRTGVDLGITGTVAIMEDISQQLNDALVPYLATVVGLAFVLLVLVFRSLLVPLTATLGFLLSVLATLGVTVALFQEGWFGIFEGGPIISFMPIILVGVVFGLAMDYQVFLVTRIREAHVHGASYRDAIVDGFRNSARVVTAAALIMTSVFAGFMLMDDVIIKSMGFALAVAVVFDAFVIRMLLIPSLMYLMKEKAWAMPKWLDRVIPNVDVEGESLERPGTARDHADSDREPANV